MGTHAKIKPPKKGKSQAVKELEQATMLNEVALSLGIKMLTKIHANDAELGKAVRAGVLNGLDLAALKSQLETESETESKENKPA